jgi:hypothetical protein
MHVSLSCACVVEALAAYNHGLPLAGAILWMKQLAIRLSCQRPQLSRWLSRKRARKQTYRCANFSSLYKLMQRLDQACQIGHAM